jgi:drug/metabolite transporter (DMT)-like permease
MWIKIAVQEVGPITLVAFRVLFGLLFGIVVIFIQRVQLARSFKEWSPLLLLGITNVAIPFFLISWGEQSIDSAVAAILDATVPLFTILIAHTLLRDDKMTWPKVLGLLIGFAGVIVLMSKDVGASFGSILGQLAAPYSLVRPPKIPQEFYEAQDHWSRPLWSCGWQLFSLNVQLRFHSWESRGLLCSSSASLVLAWPLSWLII